MSTRPTPPTADARCPPVCRRLYATGVYRLRHGTSPSFPICIQRPRHTLYSPSYREYFSCCSNPALRPRPLRRKVPPMSSHPSRSQAFSLSLGACALTGLTPSSSGIWKGRPDDRALVDDAYRPRPPSQ